MKKFLVFLFLIAIGTSVYAQKKINDRGYTYTEDSDDYFKSIDGVLYLISRVNASNPPYTHTLVKYPQNKKDITYTVPNNVRTIAKGAFQGNKYIDTIRIPSSVIYIGDNAFADCENLKTIEVYTSSSSIQAVEEDIIEKEEIGRYNINGVKVEETDDGIQIILYSDGSAEKVLEKP